MPIKDYLDQLKPKSANTIKYALRSVIKMLRPQYTGDLYYFPWSEVSREDVFAMYDMFEDLPPTTANLYLSALSNVSRVLNREGSISDDVFRVIIDLPRYNVVNNLPAGRDLGIHIVAEFLRELQASQDSTAVRDSAMVGLMAGSGMRRSEISAALYEDISVLDFSRDTMKLAARTDSGKLLRPVYLSDMQSELLFDWLTWRRDAAGPLFCHVDKLPEIVGVHPQTVYDAVERKSRIFLDLNILPQDFRHTLVKYLRDYGVAPSTIYQLTGHSIIKTSELVDPSQQSLEEALRLVDDLLIGNVTSPRDEAFVF